MIIALVVTLVAIFASQQVKTAFFKLNSLNQQISELHAPRAGSRNESQHGQLVVQVDALMVPFYRIVDRNASRAAAPGDDSVVLLRRREVRQRELSAARS